MTRSNFVRPVTDILVNDENDLARPAGDTFERAGDAICFVAGDEANRYGKPGLSSHGIPFPARAAREQYLSNIGSRLQCQVSWMTSP